MGTQGSLRLGALLGLFSACTSPPAPVADAGTEASADGSVGPACPCRTHADCSDQLFCNGVERCLPTAPGADACGCVSAARRPCLASETCDELRALCVGDTPVDCDHDDDGERSVACGGRDCDDNDPYRNPQLRERCAGALADGRSAADHDEDCNPCTVTGEAPDGDGDDDGYPATTCSNPWAPAGERPLGCDQGHVRLVSPGEAPNPAMPGTVTSAGLVVGTDCADGPGGGNQHPNQPELCNGVDDNCDGLPDESDPQATLSCGVATDGSPLRCDGTRCALASCAGPANRQDCDHSVANGCETDVNTDASHCGMCGRACAFPNGVGRCAMGVCRVATCTSGYANCGDHCGPIDSPSSCGPSCTVCPMPAAGTGVVSCTAGQCSLSCSPGFHRYGATCLANAASCGTATCATSLTDARASCDASMRCTVDCLPGLHLCGGTTSGACVPVDSTRACGLGCVQCLAPTDNGVASCPSIGGAYVCSATCSEGYTPLVWMDNAATQCQRLPLLLSPLAGAVALHRRPTLRWQPAAATQFEVRVCRDLPCRMELARWTTTGTSTRPPMDLPPGEVFWQVRTADPGAPPGWAAVGRALWIPRRSTPTDSWLGARLDLEGDGVSDVVTLTTGTGNYFMTAFSGASPMVSSNWLPGRNTRITGYGTVNLGADRDVRMVGGADVLGDDGLPELAVTLGPPIQSLSLLASPGYFERVIDVGQRAFPSLTPLPFHQLFLDFDGDGRAELFGGPPAGRTTEHYGYLTLLTNTGQPSRTSLADPPGLSMPVSSDGVAGDFDGDNAQDLVLRFVDTATGAPVLALWRGPSFLARPGALRAPDVSIPAMDPNSGQALLAVGDFNGDGLADFVELSARFSAGRVHLGHADLSNLAATAQVLQGTPNFYLTQRSVSTQGDLNGDGYTDLVVGDGSPVSGQLLLFLGGPAGLAATPQALPIYGISSVTIAVDADADGFDDLVAGAPGNAPPLRLYRGGPTGVATTPAATAAGGYYGHLLMP